MEYQQRMRELAAEQVKKEIEINKEEERLYQLRLQQAKTRPHPDKVHPKRLLKGLV